MTFIVDDKFEVTDVVCLDEFVVNVFKNDYKIH